MYHNFSVNKGAEGGGTRGWKSDVSD